MRQSELDAAMQQEGIDRVRRRVEEARRKSKESWTAYGQRLIAGAVKPVGDGLIEEWGRIGRPRAHAAGADLLKACGIDPHVAAFVAVQTVFDAISAPVKASKAFINVGRQVEFEVVCRSWSIREPYLIRRLSRLWFDKRSGVHHTSSGPKSRGSILMEGIEAATGQKIEKIWTDAECLSVGFTLVELLRLTTGMIDLVTIRTKVNRTDTYVVATADTQQYIRKVLARTEALTPLYMPMVVPPYDWKDPYNGGYNLPGVGQPLVKHDRSSVVEQMTREQMPDVYDAINFLQGVPFRVNRRILAVYQWAWENSLSIGGLPRSSDLEVPPVPPMPPGQTAESPERREAMRDWYMKAHPIKRLNMEASSQRIHYARLKHLSERFGDGSIFFPMNCDFRGRYYTQPTYLSYQGCDAAKALLEFARGKPVSTPEAKRWLKIHGANVYGIKGTHAARVAWVDKHASQILDAAKRPIENEWWRQADEPWQFLAFCFDAAAVAADPNHVSHLPCSQDGTNNGLQVLSLLLRDEVGGKATNCVPCDEPQDIYEDVAEETRRLLRAEPDADRGVWAREWLGFGVDRATTKRPVMIVPYSGTIYSAVKYVRQWFLDAVTPGRPSPWKDPTKPLGYLTRSIWKAIGGVVVKSRDAMEWFRALGDAYLAAGMDPTLVAPTGFVVAQEYPDYGKCTVRTTVKQSVRMWQIRDATERRNRTKHLNAIAPNIVHFLDAAAMTYVALGLKRAGVESVASVHDCVAVLAADASCCAEVIRVEWSKMFSADLLLQMKKQAEAMTGAALPDPPAYGNLNPADLLHSPYFFS